MANVTIPPTGSGTATPVVSTDVVTADSSNVQNVQLTSVAAGVLTRLGTAGSPLEVAIVGTVPISGAPTTVTANLGTLNGAGLDTSLQSILTKLNASVGVTGTFWQATQPVSAASLPLPTGAATQTTLAAVAAQLPAALGAHGGLVIEGVASGVAIPVTGGGTPTDQQISQTFSSATTGTPITGLNGISTVVVEVITTGNTATGVTWNVQGSQDGTNWESLSWLSTAALAYNAAGTGASNTTGVYYWLAAGFAQVRMNVVALGSGNFPTNMRTTSGVIAPRQTAVTIAANSSVNVAQMNGVATSMGHGVSGTGVQRVELPTDGTGVVGLNAGTNLVGKVGIDQTTPGTTNAVASQPIAITPTLTQVAGSGSSVTIIASNATRKAAVIVNDSTAVLKIAFAATATTSAYTYLLTAGATLELPVAGRAIYTGLISGIWASATGNAIVTDMS